MPLCPLLLPVPDQICQRAHTHTRLAHENTHEQVFSSPLGHEAAVNWVTCKDIAAVAAVALLDSSLDGSVHEYCVNAGM